MEAKKIFEEAQMLFIEGKLKESIEAFSRAIEAGADPFMAHLSRGAAYLKLKDVDMAIKDFSHSVVINPTNARPFYYRGMAYMVKGEFESAVADFSKALELKPDLLAAQFARAVCNGRLDRMDEAVEDFKVVIPQMEAGSQTFADTYGIVRTEMWRVMTRLVGEAEVPETNLTPEDISTLKKWLSEEQTS